jgi:metallo-beta-lactamase class B
MNISCPRTPLTAALLLLAACIPSAQAPPQTAPPTLGGTSWRLVKFQGSDDTTLTPDDKTKYTIEFGADGRLSARIPDGGIEFEPIAGAQPGPGAAQAPADQAALMKAWVEPTEPLRIVGPIHYVGTRELGAYLITTPEGHMLLDGAVPSSAPLIEASIRALGFKPEEIRLLLITHAHFDHVGTLAHFKKLSGAAVAVMAPDVELLASGGKTDYLFAKQPKFHFEPVTADRVLKDGDTVSLGGVQLTGRLTPGHTRGCTTWTTTIEEGGRSYDVVFPGSTSVNPGTRFVHGPSYPGVVDDYRRAISVLESLQPDIFLAAHASFFDFAGKRARAATEGVKAFVDPEGYRRRIAAQRAAFEAIVEKEK